MGRSDHYVPGDWNAQCFRCGMKRKAGELRKQWQGYWVCPEHWEPRHPQDFVRAIPDNPSVPWDQPDSWNYVGPVICTPAGTTALPGYATPGCAIPSKTLGVFP